MDVGQTSDSWVLSPKPRPLSSRRRALLMLSLADEVLWAVEALGHPLAAVVRKRHEAAYDAYVAAYGKRPRIKVFEVPLDRWMWDEITEFVRNGPAAWTGEVLDLPFVRRARRCIVERAYTESRKRSDGKHVWFQSVHRPLRLTGRRRRRDWCQAPAVLRAPAPVGNAKQASRSRERKDGSTRRSTPSTGSDDSGGGGPSRRRQQDRRWCRWCGNTIPSSRRGRKVRKDAKFCRNAHRQAWYRAKKRGEVRR